MTTHDDAPRVDHRSPDAEPAPAEERAAVPPARRRAPRRDELLAAAVDAARAGLAGLAAPDEVGEHVDVLVDDDRLLTHRFACRMPGYAGWLWYVTIARAPRAKQVTVCETGLMAGEGSLVAPPWVPYAERVNEEERERLKAVAEGGAGVAEVWGLETSEDAVAAADKDAAREHLIALLTGTHEAGALAGPVAVRINGPQTEAGRADLDALRRAARAHEHSASARAAAAAVGGSAPGCTELGRRAALVLPRGTAGMTEASTTRSPWVPCTCIVSGSTTLIGSRPILAEQLGCSAVSASSSALRELRTSSRTRS